MEKAIIAGGCFWGMQELYRELEGITDSRVGYTGGHLENPTYEDTHDSKSGHAEALELTYDPDIISYRQILEYLFQIHDPTTPNQQGNDFGTQYRSAIFYQNAGQKNIAEQLISEINASGKWSGKITTELAPASTFYEAEAYHQDYLQRHPGGYSCHWPRPDWILSP